MNIAQQQTHANIFREQGMLLEKVEEIKKILVKASTIDRMDAIQRFVCQAYKHERHLVN